ncbi:MAG: hypothetical protein EHM79_00515 [Geobacter sp.]|nr:MAG: hypothetical protein EHM79_00515 [Geobacter sp.]
MNPEQQKKLIQKCKIIHCDDTWWITFNPIASALGYSDPAKLRARLDSNIKSFHELKSHSKLMLELHPSTRLINQQGLSDLLTAKSQVGLLTWIEREFVTEPPQLTTASSVISTAPSQEIATTLTLPPNMTTEVFKIEVDGVWWMLANSIAMGLGYSDRDQAIRLHVSQNNQMEYAELKSRAYGDSSIGEKEPNHKSKFINEAGMFELINKSNKTKAIEFQNWIYNNLMPTLRRDSQYHMRDAPSTVQQQMSCISSILKPEKPNTPQLMQTDDNTNESPLSDTPPTMCFAELINEIFKINVNGVWWMLANPFARGLGYSNSNQAIRIHVSIQNQKAYEEIKSSLGELPPKNIQKTSKFINEFGLFELIGKSGKGKAEDFKKWISSDLLPTLRHDSQYYMRDASTMVQQQMSSISSILTPQKNNTPQTMFVDDNTNESPLNVAPPTVCCDELLNEIFKIYVNGVWWMLANPIARGLGYLYPNDAIRINVSNENQVVYGEIKSRIEHGGESSTSSRKNIQKTSKFINEFGLFELIGKSGKGKAENFKNWISNDLLPSLRRHSEYNMIDAPPMVQKQMEAITSVVDGNQFEFLKREMQEQRREMQEQRREMQEQRREMQEQMNQIGTLVASMKQLVEHSHQQSKIIEAQRNIIETSLTEQKVLMEQYQTNNENAIARQATVVTQQFSVINSALANHETTVAQQFSVVNAALAQQKNELSNIQPLVSAEPVDRNKFQCLEIYYKAITAGGRVMYWYHALRTQRCSLEVARGAIQPDFERFYFSDSANAVNAYNSIKDRISYSQRFSRGNKILCKHPPQDFLRAVNGRCLIPQQPRITEFFI